MSETSTCLKPDDNGQEAAGELEEEPEEAQESHCYRISPAHAETRSHVSPPPPPPQKKKKKEACWASGFEQIRDTTDTKQSGGGVLEVFDWDAPESESRWELFWHRLPRADSQLYWRRKPGIMGNILRSELNPLMRLENHFRNMAYIYYIYWGLLRGGAIHHRDDQLPRILPARPLCLTLTPDLPEERWPASPTLGGSPMTQEPALLL
ncbi:unnamed protein product [Pleuronectes platessa]|uniref:Uncharacterized protein n=1 Tax=Pleuronectes platessa TaxID=8262 RepID=A0A9N7Y8R6_PLEPL|nr:unnamed protein product [Pleuronectes platessa]